MLTGNPRFLDSGILLCDYAYLIVQRFEVGLLKMNGKPSLGRVVLFHGASGAGKSTLLEAVQNIAGFQVQLLSKCTTRKVRPYEYAAEITFVPRLPDSHDIHYRMYGNDYALSSSEIDSALEKGLIAVAAVSDLNTVHALKKRYSRKAAVVFIERDAPTERIKSYLRDAGFDQHALEQRIASWKKFADAKEKYPELFDLTLHNCGSPDWMAEQLRAFFQVTGSHKRLANWQAPSDSSARVEVLSASKALKETLASNPHLLYHLHHRDFEHLFAEIMVDLGYDEVFLTPGSRDGGFDIVAVRHDALGPLLYLVECKKYAPQHKVGVQPIRQLYAVKNVMHANAAVLVTTSHFTSGAVNFAQKVGYELSLSDYDDLVETLGMYRVNR